MKKYFASAFLALLLAVLCVVGAAAFSDTEDYRYEWDINKLYDYKLVVGINENEFGVNQPVTRQQMALFIARVVLGRTVVEPTDYTTQHPFTDITDSTYDAAISFCYENKIIAGRTPTTFDPFGRVTGQEALAMAIRALGYNDLSYPDGYIKFGYDNWMPKELYEAPTAPATRGVIAGLMYDTLTSSHKNSKANYRDQNFCTLEEMLYEHTWTIWGWIYETPTKPYQLTYFNTSPTPIAAANFAFLFGCVTPTSTEGSKRDGPLQEITLEYTSEGVKHTEKVTYAYKETYAISDINNTLQRMFNNPELLSAEGSYYWESVFHVKYISDGQGNICAYSGGGGMGFGPCAGEQKDDVSVTKVADNTYDVRINYSAPHYAEIDGKYQKDGQTLHNEYICRIQVLDPSKYASMDNIRYISFERIKSTLTPIEEN